MQTDFFRRALAAPWLVAILKRLVPPLDRFLLRISRGYVNTAMQPVALVKTVGARSGLVRETPLICMPVDGGVVLVGSNWGADSDPAWIYNLRKHPQVSLVFRGYVGSVTARELRGAEREAMWQRLVDFNPQYAEYQAGTARTLPVMLLEKPANASASP